MTPETVVEIMRHAMLMAFWLAAPLLAIGFVAGIVVSLVQIATSMQDNAFSTIPRLLAFLGGSADSDAVDVAEEHGVRGFPTGRSGPLCPLASHSRWERCWASCWC